MSISPTGKHVFSELYGVAAHALRDMTRLKTLFESTLQKSGFIILEAVFHKFPTHGEGITAAFLLQESHATFHTYPEWGTMSLDIFSCGTPDPCQVFHLIADRLCPKETVTSVATRCLASPSSRHDVCELADHHCRAKPYDHNAHSAYARGARFQ